MTSLLAFLSAVGILIGWPSAQLAGGAPAAAGGGGGTPVTQILLGGSGVSLAADLTVYGWLMGTDANAYETSASEAQAETMVADGTLNNLYVHTTNGSIGTLGTHTLTVTVRRCPGESACADTALTCNFSGATSSCTSTAGPVDVDAGDRVTVRLVTSAGASSRIILYSMKWVGTNNNESMVLARIAPAANANTSCAGFGVPRTTPTSVCTEVATLAQPSLSMAPATGFSLSGIYARALTPITAGCRRVTLQKESVDQTDYFVDLTDGTTKMDTTGTPVSLSQLDSFGIKSDPGASACTADAGSTTPSNTRFAVTALLTQTEQKFLMLGCPSNGATVGVRYAKLNGATATFAAEGNEDGPVPGMVIEDLAYEITNAPQNSTGFQSWDINVRKNATTTVTPACSIVEDAKTCTADLAETVTAGTTLDYMLSPVNTPVVPGNTCGSLAATGS